MSLRPQRIGDIPAGLPAHHREFLRRLKDAVEILIGGVVAQDETEATPGSQAVTFNDLIDLGVIGGSASTLGQHSITFMHMGAL